jgi:hypothetical protein
MLYTNKQNTVEVIFQSCRTLFPEGVQITDDFIHCLKPEGVKAAFRAKAKETHPDKAGGNCEPGIDNGEKFRRVVEAYETLLPFVSTSGEQSAPIIVETKSNNHFDLYHSGDVPSVKLRFSHYLYYRGIVSWQESISSLVWQRQNRPLFGSIAEKQGWVSSYAILPLVKAVRSGEKIGEAALRLGLLNQRQVVAILGQQMTYRAPVGAYFLNKGIISEESLKQLLRDFYFHNFRVEKSAFNKN